MKFCLYRDWPLRPLFADGLGFQRPKRDESRALWLFSSEERARTLRKTLRHDAGGFVFIGRAAQIRKRMTQDHD